MITTPEGKTHTTLEEVRTVTSKQFVLCFDNESGAKDGLKIEEDGESYVLQFEGDAAGEAVDSEMAGDGKSLVLQFKTDGQGDGEKGGDKRGMVSLLHDWGEEKEGERLAREETQQGESFVLHFHTEAQESSPSSTSFTQGQENSLELSCTATQGLVPLDGQEVVFELGGATKMEQETGEGMQMIALIEGEGEMIGDGAGCNAVSGKVSESGGAMDGIFQLEGGEGLVIIEVSTSSLRERRMHGGGETDASQESQVKISSDKSVTAETKEMTVKENNSADSTEVQKSTEDIINGPIPNSEEIQFPD